MSSRSISFPITLEVNILSKDITSRSHTYSKDFDNGYKVVVYLTTDSTRNTVTIQSVIVYKPDHVSTIFTESSRTAEAAIDKLDPTMKFASLNYTFLNNNFNLSIQVLINETDDVFENIKINNTYDATKYNFNPENLVSEEIQVIPRIMKKLTAIISKNQPDIYLFKVINEDILYTPSGPRNPDSIHMQPFIKTDGTIKITPHFFGYKIIKKNNKKIISENLEIFTYDDVREYLPLLKLDKDDLKDYAPPERKGGTRQTKSRRNKISKNCFRKTKLRKTKLRKTRLRK